MRRFILLIAVLFCVSSCYKVSIVKPSLEPAFFNDECWTSDSVAFNMACSVFPDSANIQFVKRVIHRRKTPWKAGKEALDTVCVLQEDYKYSPSAFKEMLVEKEKTRGTGDYFYFSPNMCITKSTFDEMYDTYIE